MIRSIYKLQIELAGIEPTIWRWLGVSGTSTLSHLHQALHAVMGWSNSQLYEFRIRGKGYLDPASEIAGDDPCATALASSGLGAGDSFEYVYDFGGNWEHRITVDAIVPPEPGSRYPRCLGGE